MLLHIGPSLSSSSPVRSWIINASALPRLALPRLAALAAAAAVVAATAAAALAAAAAYAPTQSRRADGRATQTNTVRMAEPWRLCCRCCHRRTW